MIHVNHYQIGEIILKISSDIVLPTTKNVLFKKFLVPPVSANAQYSFFELKKESYILSELEPDEIKSLRRTLAFPERWLTNTVFRSPAVRDAIQHCLVEPELFHLSLSWNRLIIRNFAKNEFHFFYHPENKADMTNPMFNARFRNLISLSMVNHSSFLIHGAGALTQNGAALFLAPDEGGKTTLIKKFKKSKILGDDQVVIRLLGNHYYLCGTPFGTITCGPAQNRLTGIFIIKKARHFKIISARANDVFHFIWKESFLKTIVLPKTLRIRVFNLLYSFCQRIPSFYIYAPIDYLDFKAIDETMADSKKTIGS
jgi:hypothetical protein